LIDSVILLCYQLCDSFLTQTVLLTWQGNTFTRSNLFTNWHRPSGRSNNYAVKYIILPLSSRFFYVAMWQYQLKVSQMRVHNNLQTRHYI